MIVLSYLALGLYKKKPILATIHGVVAGEMPSGASCHAWQMKVMNILPTSLPGNLRGKTPDWPTGAVSCVLIVRCFYPIRLSREDLLAGLALFIVKWTNLMNQRSYLCLEN